MLLDKEKADLKASLLKIVGESHLYSDPDRQHQWGKDWTKGLEAKPLFIVLPENSNQVSKIVEQCSYYGAAIVPSGGRTGLAGGAAALNGEIVVNLSRLNKIIALDEVGSTIEVETGVTTLAVQETAAAVGLYYPVDLASRGSAQIGGNIATNAGGLKVIRYGGTRQHILGLEVVLPSGKILDLNRKLLKNNSGYDLKHLFIGSEGTLGIITKATLRLYPPPGVARVCCLGVESMSNISAIVSSSSKRRITPTAFEFFSSIGLEMVLKHIPGSRDPFDKKFSYYLLVEFDETQGECIEEWLEEMLAKKLIGNATLSSSPSDFLSLWSLRENLTEAIGISPHVFKNDIAVPIGSLERFIKELQVRLNKEKGQLQLVLFGHIGDGNIHINYVGPSSLKSNDFLSEVRVIEKEVFGLLEQFGGSISAEHGIGILKKGHFSKFVTSNELQMMRSIKTLLDPKNIMNPGKIFDIS